MKGCSHEKTEREVLFRARDYLTKRDFTVTRCRGCALVMTDPQPAAQDLGAFYPQGYYGAAGSPRFPAIAEVLQRALYMTRARAVERLAGQPGRVLDVGCGRGHLLDAFRRRGWDVQGTELSAASSAHAREVLGLPVHVGEIDAWPWPEAHFDAVTLWHVLEHWREPGDVLASVSRVLRPGGVLMIGVPNVDSIEARLARQRWFHLDVPRHLVHLSPRWLEANLAGAGLAVRRWSYFAPEYDAFSFVQSALNLAGIEQNLLYDLLRGRTAKVAVRPPPTLQSIVSLLAAIPLGLVSVPATLLAGLTASGSSVTVLAVKNEASPGVHRRSSAAPRGAAE